MAGEYITIEEMCKNLGGVHSETIKRMINRGELPPFDIGRNNSKVKAWHKAVLKTHALQRYEQFGKAINHNF